MSAAMSQIGLRAGQLCARKQVSLERLPVHARARNCRTLLRARASASAAEEDKPVVFVAGGVGRTGIRVVRELTERGFKVRAGVRNVDKANAIFSGKEAPSGVGYTGKQDKKPAPIDTSLVEAVKFDVTDPSTLPTAIGNASVVVSCLGAPESEAFNPTLPKAIDGEGTKALVRASKAAGVKHFLMVSSLGTGKFGWPASILNLFWEVLKWKKEAEDELVASGIPFTIIRPGGMERPTDDHGLTHKVLLVPADTRFGGTISRLQVAGVVAEAIGAPAAAANKIVEAVAEEKAPVRPIVTQLENVEAIAAGPQPEGTPGAFNAKYAYKGPSETAKWLEIMSFGGSAPEAVNSRAAMLGAAALLLGEFQGKGTIWQQLDRADQHPLTEITVVAVIISSLIPLLKGVSARDATAGPFSPAAELFNGRLAMLALAAMGYLEWRHGIPVLDHPWPFY